MQTVDLSKKFICECGKCFAKAQSYNGHKSHCKEHLIAKGGHARYEEYLAAQAAKLVSASSAVKTKACKNREDKLQIWLASKPCCERCGKVMTEKFGSGRFCSDSCAHARSLSEDSKQKIRDSLNKTLLDQQKSGLRPKKSCCVCGCKIKSYNKTGYCKVCLETTPEGLQVKQALGKKGYVTMQANGTHHSWQSRKITSFAEKYWMQVLDNYNIKYTREVPVKHEKSNYFLDFVIEHNGKVIDLEIDGKQHTYIERKALDEVRDHYLSGIGYIIYRIPWNALKTAEGKAEMQNKIEKFLQFYAEL